MLRPSFTQQTQIVAILAEQNEELVRFNSLGSDSLDRGEFFRILSGVDVGEIPSLREPDEREQFQLEQDQERLVELEAHAGEYGFEDDGSDAQSTSTYRSGLSYTPFNWA